MKPFSFGTRFQMQPTRNIALVLGAALLVLGLAASLQDAERGDPLGLRLFPALLFHLNRPFVGGGDFPASLSGVGIIAVYVVPGLFLIGLALIFRRHPDAPKD